MKKYYAIFVISIIFLTSCGIPVNKTVQQDFKPPTIKFQPKLMYPRIAQKNSDTGKLKLLLVIDKKGSVEKVKIIDSSGSEILDEAGYEYCKNLVFNPASSNGEPISSRMNWEIKFAILDQNWDPFLYADNVQFLYKKHKESSTDDYPEIENEILNQHTRFIKNMTDVLNYNYFISRVIEPKLVDKWKKDWDSWPLSFLLYYDFIERFPNYDSIPKVSALMLSTLKNDLHYIQNTSVATVDEETEKDLLVKRIKDFVSEKYPNIILDWSTSNFENFVVSNVAGNSN